METTALVITVKEHELMRLEAEAEALRVCDDVTEEAAMLLIACFKGNVRDLEAERKAFTDPLNAEIKAISAPYKEAVEKCTVLLKKLEGFVTEYRNAKRLAQQAEQRRLIEQAEQDRLAKQAEEDEARQAADAARAAGDLQGAATFDAWADEAAMAGAGRVIEVLPTQQKTVGLVTGAKVTFKETADWLIPGLTRGEAVYRTHPLLSLIPDDYWMLDEKKISKVVKAGITVPGVTIVTKTTTAVRR